MENPASKGASMASVQGSTGVDQDRGMCEEKRNDDRPEEGGTLNSGSRVASGIEEIYLQRPNNFQPTEGIAKSHQDSDLPIVVRDGNTDQITTDTNNQILLVSVAGLAVEVAHGTVTLDCSLGGFGNETGDLSLCREGRR